MNSINICSKNFLLISSTLIALEIFAQEVIPDFYKDPGITSNRSYVNQSESEYIDPFTGALKLSYIDLHIPGNGGMDINIIRSYNSSIVDLGNTNGAINTAGWGWNIHFGRIISSTANPCMNKIVDSVVDNPVLELPDGSRQMLFYTGSTSPRLISQNRWKVECPSATSPVVYNPNGIQYEMSQSVASGTQSQPIYEFHVKKITDPNGNWIRIDYSRATSPAITRVTTNDGRSVSFGWIGIDSTRPRISSITAEGRTYNYNYESAPQVAGIYHLKEVERPDKQTWMYSYFGFASGDATNFLLKEVANPFGGTARYNYDFVYFGADSQLTGKTPAIVRKELSTGGVWSYRYNPGGASQYDSTTVSSPDGTIVYKHFSPKNLPAGSIWKAGLLMEKTIGSDQTEKYTWTGQKISSDIIYSSWIISNKSRFFGDKCSRSIGKNNHKRWCGI